jgi:hypothetical protein
MASGAAAGGSTAPLGGLEHTLQAIPRSNGRLELRQASYVLSAQSVCRRLLMNSGLP